MSSCWRDGLFPLRAELQMSGEVSAVVESVTSGDQVSAEGLLEVDGVTSILAVEVQQSAHGMSDEGWGVK